MNEKSQLIINRENAWVLIGFGHLRLMIPQQQVETLESYAVMEMGVARNSEIGRFETDSFNAPIYCFSDQLKLLQATPPDYDYFVIIRHQQCYFGLCCESISTHSAGPNNVELPLPGCMLSANALFKHYALLNNQLYLVSNSDTLLSLIQSHTNNSLLLDDSLQHKTSSLGVSS